MSDIQKEQTYWANRAKNYSKLEWASRGDYLQAVIQAGDLQPKDVVLDAGTGTGMIANGVAPHVESIIGVDISREMMDGLNMSRTQNCEFEIGDIRNLRFPTGYFSKVFARMVFHSLMDSTDRAAQECYRVLRPGGRFVLSEGIPPAKFAEPWYTEMFRLKETRLTFFPEILEGILSLAGFSDIHTEIHVSPQVSIANWLENSGLSSARQRKIMQMHLEMPPEIRKEYRATFNGDEDVLLDMKFAIVVGTRARDESGS